MTAARKTPAATSRTKISAALAAPARKAAASSMVKTSTQRRLSRQAKERQAALAEELAAAPARLPGKAVKTGVGRAAQKDGQTLELPGIAPVVSPDVAPVPSAKPGAKRTTPRRTASAVAAQPEGGDTTKIPESAPQKKTPGKQAGRSGGPSTTEPRKRTRLDKAKSSIEVGQLQFEDRDRDGRSLQIELFIVPRDNNALPVKDDVMTMEFPFFTLSKKKDIKERHYSRAGITLKIFPSTLGLPTMFDKDLLIYLGTQIAAAKNRGEPVSRRMHINVGYFLNGTNRSRGGDAYARVIDMCGRLKGTLIQTNIESTESERTTGFSMIDNYSVERTTSNGKGALELEITLSEWFFRAVHDLNVLTLNPAYFRLSQPLERRLYELARKHVGAQPWFEIYLDTLQLKTGSTSTAKKFKQEIKAIVQANQIPDYRLALDESCRPAKLVMMSTNNAKLISAANARNKAPWIMGLLQQQMS